MVAITEKPRLLEFVTGVNIPAIDRFVVRDHCGVGKKNGVKIAWLGDNFQRHFLDKIEEGVEAAELKIHKLLQASLDSPIITELGDRHEITFGQLFVLLQKQGKGEQGPLPVNGWANIAYIRDQDGALWAADAAWDEINDGWSVEASSVENPYGWDDGHQVVSR